MKGTHEKPEETLLLSVIKGNVFEEEILDRDR